MVDNALQITFRDIDPSEALSHRALQKFNKLRQIHDRISRCHVVVESPHLHHQKGNLFNVRIDLHVPGGVITVNQQSHENHSHEDAYVAMRDAFNKARRRLVALNEKRKSFSPAVLPRSEVMFAG